jgi:hypothetical protein
MSTYDLNIYDPHAWGTGTMSGAWVALKVALYKYTGGHELIAETELTAAEAALIGHKDYDGLDYWVSLDSFTPLTDIDKIKNLLKAAC